MTELTRLLIIDDDKSLLLGLAETLKREGAYQVITADNGNMGIKLAKENLPQLIICDLMMPPPRWLGGLKIPFRRWKHRINSLHFPHRSRKRAGQNQRHEPGRR